MRYKPSLSSIHFFYRTSPVSLLHRHQAPSDIFPALFTSSQSLRSLRSSLDGDTLGRFIFCLFLKHLLLRLHLIAPHSDSRHQTSDIRHHTCLRPCVSNSIPPLSSLCQQDRIKTSSFELSAPTRFAKRIPGFIDTITTIPSNPPNDS